MSAALTVLNPGLQTTLQAGPRRGHRHQGVPASGAADIVSLALANRLVGAASDRRWDAPAIELTLTGASFRAERDVCFAVTGAPCAVTVGGRSAAMHETLWASVGSEIVVGPATAGCRTYLALAGGFTADRILGSASTYLPASLGGHDGRTLTTGDVLASPGEPSVRKAQTPDNLRQHFGDAWTLRAAPGPEAKGLSEKTRAALFGQGWTAARASDRLGVRLDGPPLEVAADARLDSVPVLPGTVQLPPGGAPIILGPDSGTTGGYARAAQVIRADRHLIGQLRPGTPVRLLEWPTEEAVSVLAAKTALIAAWVGESFGL